MGHRTLFGRRPAVRRKVAAKLMREFKGCAVCGYCGYLIEDGEATIDHVIPLSKGGTNAIENLVMACWICNGKKKDKLWEPYYRTWEDIPRETRDRIIEHAKQAGIYDKTGTESRKAARRKQTQSDVCLSLGEAWPGASTK